MAKTQKKVRLGAIFTEQDKSREGAYKLSLGRVMSWVMFTLLMILWATEGSVPESLILIFLTIMGYNLGTKFHGTLSMLAGNRKNSNVEDDT